ncbi:uncharacterized protein [Eurosta solidaginis]|uniref:uncharacterized protein n=1 Tax=Eurosta solidaginis TaxID=178769 RepID=UPI003531401F
MLYITHLSCASILGTPFGTFTSFGAPTPLLASPHSHHSPHHSNSPISHHHQHSPAPAAFFPSPFLYWSYPSPPVSPTAYYGQPPSHSKAQLAANITTTQHQAMYSLDFLPAHQPSALSPPSVALPSPSSYMPPKQFSALPPYIPTGVGGSTGGSTGGSRAAVGSLSPYHNKIALPIPLPPQQQTNNIYRHYNSSPVMPGSPQSALLTLPPTSGSGSPLPLTRQMPATSNTPLLTVGKLQNERPTTQKVTSSTSKIADKINYSRDVTNPAVTASNVRVVPNTCMELYIA